MKVIKIIQCIKYINFLRCKNKNMVTKLLAIPLHLPVTSASASATPCHPCPCPCPLLLGLSLCVCFLLLNSLALLCYMSTFLVLTYDLQTS